MGGARVIVPLTREDVGGGRMGGGQLALIAGASDGGVISHAHSEVLISFRVRGLIGGDGRLTEKGFRLRRKLKGYHE